MQEVLWTTRLSQHTRWKACGPFPHPSPVPRTELQLSGLVPPGCL